MRRLALILTFLVVLALTGSLALARSGDLAIPWFTVSSGGASDGASYALRGTSGQAAAGRMSGGEFAVSGGYWSGLSPPQPEGGAQIYLPLVVK